MASLHVMLTIWFPLSGLLGFIDFEYAAFNYEAYDIGILFLQYAGKVLITEFFEFVAFMLLSKLELSS